MTFLLPSEDTGHLKKPGLKGSPKSSTPKHGGSGIDGEANRTENLGSWHITYGDTDVV
jgi:hypothetical protein